MLFFSKLMLLLCVVAARMTSIHSAWKEEVHDVPMSVIIRPIMPELTEKKVESLMETIQVSETYYLLIQFNLIPKWSTNRLSNVTTLLQL